MKTFIVYVDSSLHNSLRAGDSYQVGLDLAGRNATFSRTNTKYVQTYVSYEQGYAGLDGVGGALLNKAVKLIRISQ